MKRNGRNEKMPHDGVMVSDAWSVMTNTQRRDYKNIYNEDKKVVEEERKKYVNYVLLNK